MSRNYSITEPHPSVPATHYFHAGRGGAGNYTQVNPSQITTGSTASGPASRTTLTPPPANGYFAAGRGGAGNMYRERERAIFSFDEELERQHKVMEHQAPMYHVGRGGAGNVDGASHEKRRGSSGSSESSGSVRKSMEQGLNKIRDSFSSRH